MNRRAFLLAAFATPLLGSLFPSRAKRTGLESFPSEPSKLLLVPHGGLSARLETSCDGGKTWLDCGAVKDCELLLPGPGDCCYRIVVENWSATTSGYISVVALEY